MLEAIVVAATLTSTCVVAVMAHARKRSAESVLARYAEARGLTVTAPRCATGVDHGVPYSVMLADDAGVLRLRVAAGRHARTLPFDADARHVDVARDEVVARARATSGIPPYR